MSGTPILYSFRRCPYAMRARMALAYAQQVIEVREITLKEKPMCMLAYSPKGTVPVLITNQNQVLEESLEIMQWALERNDPEHWLNELAQQEPLIKENDLSFKTKLDHYKYADRHPESEAFYREQSLDFPDALNRRLAAQPYLCGKQLSMADIAIFPFIRQYAHVDLDWFNQTDWPHLQRWLTELKASKLFNLIMTKYTPWKPGELPVYLATTK